MYSKRKSYFIYLNSVQLYSENSIIIKYMIDVWYNIIIFTRNSRDYRKMLCSNYPNQSDEI